MEKQEYIKAIEKLNEEQIIFENNKYYKKLRNIKIMKKLVKSREYKKAWKFGTRLIKNEFIKEPQREKIEYKMIQNNENIENKRKVVYTCILKNYDRIYTPLIKTENTDYIVFSDNKEINKNTDLWQVKSVPDRILQLCKNNPTLINRYIKMHPKELFPDYDYALYIDGSIRVISDIEELFQRINKKTGLGMHVHPKRIDVYEESKACIRNQKKYKKNIEKQIQKYRQEGFPEKYGLLEATVIAVDLNNADSKEILDDWWKEFLNSETYRDQLIFTYILWKKNYEVHDVGILGENVSLNPKFRRYMHPIHKKRKRMKHIYNKYIRPKHIKNRIKYFGLKYQCNICRAYVKEMFPSGFQHEIFQKNQIVGAGYREHVYCPICIAKDKERMVFYYIKKYTDILTGKNTILHFAPENVTRRKIMKNQNATYYNGDISKEHGDMIVDITNIEFEDNTFDYIICNHVLEHILDEKKAIAELKRVIKPGGKIILTVPICISNENTIEDKTITDPEERMKHFCQQDHVRLYGRDFKERLESYGLQVEEYNFEKQEGKRKVKKYGILEKGCIYIAKK